MIRTVSVNKSASSFVNPTSISGLKVWLDFSDTATMNLGVPPTDGIAITQISDKSANAFSFVGSVNQYPLYKTNIQNSLGVARFDGTNDFLRSDLTTDISVFTAFALTYSSSNRQYNVIISADVQGAGQLTIEQGATNSINCYIIGTGIVGGTGNNTFPVSTWNRTTTTYTSGTGVNFIGSASLGTFSTAGAKLEASKLCIGNDVIASFFCSTGDFAEVIIYDSILSAGDLTLVDNYLKAKWSVS